MKKSWLTKTQVTVFAKDYAGRKVECTIYQTPWGDRYEYRGKLYSIDKEGNLTGGFDIR